MKKRYIKVLAGMLLGFVMLTRMWDEPDCPADTAFG